MRVQVSPTYNNMKHERGIPSTLEQRSTHSNAEATLASSFEARVFGNFMVIKLIVLDEITANRNIDTKEGWDEMSER